MQGFYEQWNSSALRWNPGHITKTRPHYKNPPPALGWEHKGRRILTATSDPSAKYSWSTSANLGTKLRKKRTGWGPVSPGMDPGAAKKAK